MPKVKRIHWNWSDKHKAYMRKCLYSSHNVAEGSIRSGKTTDNTYVYAYLLKRSKDKVHLVTASTQPTAKLIVGDGDGFGLEHIFRGQCRWGKYKDNDALIIKGVDTGWQEKIVLFCGAAKADSYKKFRGMTIGLWLATEIDLHHENSIREAMRRQVKAHTKKLFWDMNPGSPTDFIYTEFIDEWQEKADAGTFVGGYNYESFNIYDNINIPEQNLKEFVSMYTPGTVFYRRDIDGVRCVAEGLCYLAYANEPDKYHITQDKVPLKGGVIIGVDYGKESSDSAFVATLIANKTLYVLKARSVSASGKTFEQMKQEFQDFMFELQNQYPEHSIQHTFADSAEPTYNNSLRHDFPQWRIRGSIKRQIIDRIRALNIMLSAGKFFMVKDLCEDLHFGLVGAVWDSKQMDDVRLDDGTSNIDILDALEYAFEYYIPQLVRLEA